MIKIVIGTNRKNSKSETIARIYQRMLNERREDAEILSMNELPEDFAFSALYENTGKNQAFNVFVERLRGADKMVFVIPEYNNSFPGVLKTFFDGLPYPSPLAGKWAALVGVSTGVQGASLALSHLTDILNYLGMNVLATKPRLAQIASHLSEDTLQNPIYQRFLEVQMDELIKL